MSRIYVEQDRIRDTAKKIMVEVIYHNLAKVRNMYQSTFKIEFPGIAAMAKCVSIRHDLVHRNGKTKDNRPLSIDNAVIADLIKNVSYFAEDIAKKLKLPRKKEI